MGREEGGSGRARKKRGRLFRECSAKMRFGEIPLSRKGCVGVGRGEEDKWEGEKKERPGFQGMFCENEIRRNSTYSEGVGWGGTRGRGTSGRARKKRPHFQRISLSAKTRLETGEGEG